MHQSCGKYLQLILRIIFVCAFAGILTASFYNNALGIADQRWFENHQLDTEAHVIGRLVIARSHGLFSFGGLTGIGVRRQPDPNRYRRWPRGWHCRAQYKAYLQDESFEHFNPYLSQPGGQAILFAIADRILPGSSETKLKTFRFITSFITAAVLSMALLWFLLEFGWLAAIFAGVTLVLSESLTVFGRNLWWSIWSFYVPMVALMFLLRYRKLSTCKYRWLALVVFSTVFLKCLLTGYEYITTALVMMVVPLAFYTIKQWPGPKRCSLQWSVVIGVSALAGVLSFILLCTQIRQVRSTFKGCANHVLFSFGKRTHGDPEDFPRRYTPSLKASTLNEIKRYNNETYTAFSREDPSVEKDRIKILYKHLLIAFAIVSGVGLVLCAVPLKRLDKRLMLGAVITTWFALLGPYSWFLIFKAHSYVHHHMNHITWQMPFTLFGFAFCGFVLEHGIRSALRDSPGTPSETTGSSHQL